MKPIDFSVFEFSPIIDMGEDYTVLDFSAGPGSFQKPKTAYSIGKYNEKRPGMYTADIFDSERCIHMGVDMGGPVNTPLKAFYQGSYFKLGINNAPGDYGAVIVTQHQLNDISLYALWGHLSHASLNNKKEGDTFEQGDVIAFIGDEAENGGWPPHVHFQLSLIAPDTHDMPGVVAPADLEAALKQYPDPRCVLGPLY